LKQLKVASLSVNDADETTGLVKKSPFLRTIFLWVVGVDQKEWGTTKRYEYFIMGEKNQ
jgi:hypothetical protein